MTDKRFKQVYGEMGLFRVKDNKTGDYYKAVLCGNPFTETDKPILDVLNEIAEENEQLERRIGNLEHTKDFCDEVCADCERLESENKQLKMENNSLKLLVQNWEALDEEKDGQLDKQDQALKKIKKENDQLKQDNKILSDYRDWIIEDMLITNDEKARLHEENEQLKHKLQQQEMEYATTCNRLTEENEQLKNELNSFKESVLLQGNMVCDLSDQLTILKKENEQLRKENEKLESLWEDKCIKEYMGVVGEYALQEMHKEKYGDK